MVERKVMSEVPEGSVIWPLLLMTYKLSLIIKLGFFPTTISFIGKSETFRMIECWEINIIWSCTKQFDEGKQNEDKYQGKQINNVYYITCKNTIIWQKYEKIPQMNTCIQLEIILS